MDTVVYPQPLPECRIEIADNLHQSGRAEKCGACGKPFTAARTLSSVARIRHINPDGVQHAWTWPLCRKCTRDDKHDGSVRMRLADEVHAEPRLMLAPAGGVA